MAMFNRKSYVWNVEARLHKGTLNSRIPWIKSGKCPRCDAKMGPHMVREPSLRYCMNRRCTWLTCTSCLITYNTRTSRLMPLAFALED